MEVASTTLRRPGRRGRDGAVLVARVEGAVERARSRRSGRAAARRRRSAVRRISPWPGRKTSRLPVSSASARSTARTTLVLQAQALVAAEVAGLDREHARPWLSITGASPSSARDRARRRGSPTSPGCAGPRAAAPWASRARARPRSASRLRSWNSSKITPATPSSAGIVQDHAGEDALGDHLDAGARPRPCDCIRTRKPTVSPTGSPRVAAIRSAAARAARRRGSSTMILPPADPGLVQQRQRDDRGLARARRGDQHGARCAAQRRLQRWQGLVDRQHGRRGLGRPLARCHSRRCGARGLGRAPRAGASASRRSRNRPRGRCHQIDQEEVPGRPAAASG